MHLRLVLTIGALPLPEERRSIDADDVDATVGDGEHRGEHRLEHLRIAPVEIPLEGVERRPHPADALDVGEVAGCLVREDLRQRALVSVRDLPIGKDPVEVAELRIARGRGPRPVVLGSGVVEDEVDAERHPPGVEVCGERLEIVHRAETWVHRVVVDDGVTPVAVTMAWRQQGHQVEIGDAELVEVVQTMADARQIAREAVGVGDVSDHACPLEPSGIDLPSPVERPQRLRSAHRGVEHPVQHAPHERSQCAGVAAGAVQPVEWLDEVEVVLLETSGQAFALHTPERPPQPSRGRRRARCRARREHGPGSRDRDCGRAWGIVGRPDRELGSARGSRGRRRRRSAHGPRPGRR